MLTDVFKALELLIAVVRKTPDQKRQQLAKDLHKVYLDIDDIVLRGKKLMALFGTHTLVAKAAVEVLLEQQAALNSLAIHFRKIEPILKIHLPLSATLNIAIQFKGEEVVFLLNWLLNSPSPQKGPELSLPDGYSAMTPMVRQFLLSKHFTPEELALEESGSDPLDPWVILFQQPISRSEWSDEQLRHATILVATVDDLRRAQDTLNSIAEIGEELRLLLVENFKLEDLL